MQNMQNSVGWMELSVILLFDVYAWAIFIPLTPVLLQKLRNWDFCVVLFVLCFLYLFICYWSNLSSFFFFFCSNDLELAFFIYLRGVIISFFEWTVIYFTFHLNEQQRICALMMIVVLSLLVVGGIVMHLFQRQHKKEKKRKKKTEKFTESSNT